jgi:chromosome segregation ATPase
MGFGTFFASLVGYFSARDLAEMKKKLAEHDERLSNHDERLSNHDERLSNHDERLSNHDADIDQLKFGQKDYDLEYRQYCESIIYGDD